MANSIALGRADLASGSMAVTAAGTAAATATQLTAMINLVTTATSEAGVKLPQNHAAGSPIVVISTASTVAMSVYPPTTAGKINSATGAFAMSTSNKPAVFYAHPNGVDYTAVLGS